MSDNYPSEPYPAADAGAADVPTAPAAPPVYVPPGGSASSGRDDASTTGSATDTAKEQAEHVAGVAKERAANLADATKGSAKDVASTAKAEGRKVAATAKRQAKDLIEETRWQLTEQAGTQQKKVATGLHSLSDELRDMSDASSGSGVAADLVSQAASRADSLATWLDDRDPGSLLAEVQDFARRKPGTFIAVAAIAGVVAGRLTRSLVSEAKDSSDETPASVPSTQAAPASADGLVPPVSSAHPGGSDGVGTPVTGAYRS